MNDALEWMTSKVGEWKNVLKSEFNDGSAFDVETETYVHSECYEMQKRVWDISAEMTLRIPKQEGGHNHGVEVLTSCRDQIDRVSMLMRMDDSSRLDRQMWLTDKKGRLIQTVTTRYDADGNVMWKQVSSEDGSVRMGIADLEYRMWMGAQTRMRELIRNAIMIEDLISKNKKLILTPRSDTQGGDIMY